MSSFKSWINDFFGKHPLISAAAIITIIGGNALVLIQRARSAGMIITGIAVFLLATALSVTVLSIAAKKMAQDDFEKKRGKK